MKEQIRTYTEEDIKSLNPLEHIRLRPGMYIGRLGNGSVFDDGIYVCLKEIIDNSIDEAILNYCDKIEVTIKDNVVKVKDNGRGIPLDKVEDCVGKINTSAKYGTEAYKASIGLNGVGSTCVNALSDSFTAHSFREGKFVKVEFSKGKTIKKSKGASTYTGTEITYHLDEEVFGKYSYNMDFVRKRLHNYACLNPGLMIVLNDNEEFFSSNGLLDLLNDRKDKDEFLYSPIRLVGEDIEVVITHNASDSEDFVSFVNGQYTSQGGTHQSSFREAVAKTIKEFFKKDYEPSDIRNGIVAAIKVSVVEPEFESQTKIRLSSKYMNGLQPGETVRQYIMNFLKTELDNYLVKYSDIAGILESKVKANLAERKAISGIKKKAKETLKKASLNNKKLRDCKIHYNDKKDPLKDQSSIFIVEGLSAGANFITARDPKTQAIFSLRGKPLNTYGMTKKVIYENEEFALFDSALFVDTDDKETLRYNNIYIASDSDIDGYHIRLLFLTFIAQFYPWLINEGHVYCLKTPLYKVRNKKETIYCYDNEEKEAAVKKLKKDIEIVRFKGLGEISPDEFKNFIKDDIHLEKISFEDISTLHQTLKYYMANNTPERQDYVMQHLMIE